jgi:ParB-like chromosome segregation protein Spo0J
LLGWTTIPARIIQTISAGETAAKGLIENLQREDLNPMEEAEGFDHLNKLSPDYWDQNQIAKVTGRTQGYISQSLSLLKLAPEIQENIRRLIFSRSLGLEIGRIEDHNQQRKVAKVLGKKPTIKKARERVDMELGWKSRNSPKKAVADPLAPVWAEVLSDHSIAPQCAWKVEYKEETWQFSFSAHGVPPIEALHNWFEKITQKIKPIVTGEGSPQKIN